MRRLLMVVGSLSILGSVVVFTGGTAWAAPIGVGTGTCKFTAGVGTITPPITLAGAAGVKTVKVKFNVATAKDCGMQITFPAGGHVTGIVSLKAKGTYKRALGFANSCANFVAGDVVKMKVKVNWIAAPAIAPTKATFSTSTYAPANITYSAFTAWAGSFTTSAAAGKVVMSSNIPNLTACTALTNVGAFNVTGEFIQV